MKHAVIFTLPLSIAIGAIFLSFENNVSADGVEFSKHYISKRFSLWEERGGNTRALYLRGGRRKSKRGGHWKHAHIYNIVSVNLKGPALILLAME